MFSTFTLFFFFIISVKKIPRAAGRLNCNPFLFYFSFFFSFFFCRSVVLSFSSGEIVDYVWGLLVGALVLTAVPGAFDPYKSSSPAQNELLCLNSEMHLFRIVELKVRYHKNVNECDRHW